VCALRGYFEESVAAGVKNDGCSLEEEEEE
jgi:hypothetical protein